MARYLTATIVLVLLATSIYAQRRRNRYVVGDLRIHTLKSEIFNNTRNIRVLVPEGYRRSKESYPVLYLQDGQNLFDPKTSQFSEREWGVDETILSLVRERKIQKLIVVGIDNPGLRDRGNEYLPWEDIYLEPPIKNPNGTKYPDFLTTEVMPFVESLYRIKKGPPNTAIGGASYGGLITLYTIIQKPGVFGGALIESPSFYVNEAKVLELSAEAETWPSRVYLGVGTNELGKKDCDPGDESHEAVVDVKKLQKIVTGKTEVKVVVEPCATHTEISWGSRLSGALEFLFPASG